MKVGFFIPGLHGGGAERVIITIANKMALYGHKVDLILAYDLPKESYTNEICSSVNIIRLSSTSTFQSFFPLVFLLRKKRYNSVISTLTSANVVLTAAVKLFSRQTKVVIREANTPEQESKLGGYKIKALNFLAKYTYPLADELVAVSQNVYSSLLKTYKVKEEKLALIYNPVDFDYIKKQSYLDVDIKSFVRNEDKLLVGIGRLSEQKNFKVLVDAMGELVKYDEGYKLIILGEGHLRQELERKILSKNLNKNIFLLGFKDNVFPYLRRADYFVLSSLYEGLPSVIIQALLCNCKVVVSDSVLSAPEILNGEQFGNYFKSNDAVHLAQQIIEMSNLGRCGDKACYEFVKKNFSIESTIPKYMKVLGLCQ